MNGLQNILNAAQQLSSQEQAQLIKHLADMLAMKTGAKQKIGGLIYGKYRSQPQPESTEEDFRLAEWHPTEEELNGD
jgi:hypothetical protein